MKLDVRRRVEQSIDRVEILGRDDGHADRPHDPHAHDDERPFRCHRHHFDRANVTATPANTWANRSITRGSIACAPRSSGLWNKAFRPITDTYRPPPRWTTSASPPGTVPRGILRVMARPAGIMASASTFSNSS